MKLLIKQATIIDNASIYHSQKMDILIVNGKIAQIEKAIKPSENIKVIESGNLHVSNGWMDIGIQLGEPGLEHRETFSSAVAASKSGGYTALAPFPNTFPVLQNKAAISVLQNTAKQLKINIYPIAAVTKDCDGEELTEMYDMQLAGAYGFSDGLKTVQHNGVLLNALNYVKSFNGIIIHFPQDSFLSKGGLLHEGYTSTLLGMKGIPSIAENITVQRDLALLEYTASKLCLYGVSTKEVIKSIKSSKSENLSVVVPYLNLVKEDNQLSDFNSNLKVTPPLRSKKDQDELIKALKDNIITAISSNHYPIEDESKNLEFPYAKFGASGIETTFSSLVTFTKGKLSLETIIEKLTTGPRSILNIPNPQIKVDYDAELTLFDPDISWSFTETKSISKNNPFLGTTFKGKVIGTLVQNSFSQNE
jgi:dihydroorotase